MKSCIVGSRITMLLLAAHSQGSKWCIDEDVLKQLKADINMLYVITLLEDV